MIGQYLSNTNENATVSILQKNLELNKAYICSVDGAWESGAVCKLYMVS